MPVRAVLKAFAVFCVAVLLSIGGAGAEAEGDAAASRPPQEMLTGGEVASLLGWAAKLGGYMKPTGRPHVYPITPDEIRRVVCLNFACSAVAFFNPATDVIYADDRLRLREDVVAQSYVVHEMVHYLQHVTGKIGDSATLQSCEERMALEMEAYRVQNKFLAAMGSMERVMGGSLLARLC